MSVFALKYFQLTDVITALAWLIFLLILVIHKSLSLETVKLARLYRLNFYFKIFFAIIFAIYYVVITGGGDTTAFWDDAKCVQNLILQDPVKGLEHLFVTPTRINYVEYFDSSTGFPPGWIYREPESHFVGKVVAFVGFLSLNSYLATTFIFAFLFARANWKIYELALKSDLFIRNKIHYAILFIPSVAFWCSGITKDTLMLISFFYVFYHLYFIFKGDSRSIKRWFFVIFYMFLIYQIRSFLIIAVIVPLLVLLIKKLNNRMNLAPVIRVPFNLTMLLIILGIAVAFMSSNAGSKLIMNNSAMQEALVVQNDFATNETYGKNQYSLGTVDNSPFGIVKKMPIAIFSGIYEPLPWKGLSISLFLNAVESAILLFLIIRLIVTGKIIRWARTIGKNEILVFCLVFVLLLAFIAGFTAIIYGVLVRFRAPLLPFWFALFTIKMLEKPAKEMEKPSLKGLN